MIRSKFMLTAGALGNVLGACSPSGNVPDGTPPLGVSASSAGTPSTSSGAGGGGGVMGIAGSAPTSMAGATSGGGASPGFVGGGAGAPTAGATQAGAAGSGPSIPSAGGASGGSSANGGSAGATVGGGAGGTEAVGGATATAGATATFGPDVEGPCTASEVESTNASGSGAHDVIIETNSDPGIDEGTIYRPSDLGGDELYPIFVWGEGGCSQNGLSNQAAMAEIASHGYFVVADGTPGGQGSRSQGNDVVAMGEPLLAYIDWAINENSKPCSAYYHALDASKVASNGFSCGGLMSTGTAGDPRITTWGSTSSGTFSDDQALYSSVHTPVLIIEGGPSDIAYENGLRDYENIAELGIPIMFFSKDIGHGGDLFQGGSGDFTKLNLAWLNWWLKGDETETGMGVFVGPSCSYCTDSEWEVMSENF